MSTKNKKDLKADFQTGSDITQEKFEHLIDSFVNKVDDLSIDTNGNVGIGTSKPSLKLEIYSSAGNSAKGIDLSQGASGNNRNSGRLFFSNKGELANSFSLVKSGDSFSIASNAKPNSTTGTPRLIIHNSGDVGIGISKPSAKLEVDGNIKVTHIVQEDWQDLKLENSWVRYSDEYNPPQYFKDSQGVVHLRGLIKNGKDKVVSTLPTDYRPSFAEVHIGNSSSNVSCRIDITKAGEIKSHKHDGVWVSLDGITFRTA